MKLAIVGTGISGMTAASQLCKSHDLTVFEAGDYIGGHTRTVDVELHGQRLAVDTGFIVFNDRTYPNFEAMLRSLEVPVRNTNMSFSLCCERSGLEYNGNNLNALFAQRRNLFRPSFHRMIRDILRFNREAPAELDKPGTESTLSEYLEANHYSREFREDYIIPMAAAIWSAEHDMMGRMPLRFFVRFFLNHGLLSINNRPQWKTIEGGSRTYMQRLVEPFRPRIRLSTPVAGIRRQGQGVAIELADGTREHFEGVILATHSDQALSLLHDASDAEREILAATPYQENDAVLHTDTRILPRRKLAWAAWNYHRPAREQERVAVTYNMNILQGLKTPKTLCVTLNHTASIRPECIIQRTSFHHPVFTFAGLHAQARWAEINGVRRTWFCGAYWGYGFHEDGVKSGLRVAEQILEGAGA